MSQPVRHTIQERVERLRFETPDDTTKLMLNKHTQSSWFLDQWSENGTFLAVRLTICRDTQNEVLSSCILFSSSSLLRFLTSMSHSHRCVKYCCHARFTKDTPCETRLFRLCVPLTQTSFSHTDPQKYWNSGSNSVTFMVNWKHLGTLRILFRFHF